MRFLLVWLGSRIIEDINTKSSRSSVSDSSSGFKYLSCVPEHLKKVVSDLRLWGVYCPLCSSIVFHSVKRSECERFLKSARFAPDAFIVRFDSAY